MIEALEKKSLNEFTRTEFLEFVICLFEGSYVSEAEDDSFVAHFDHLVSPHPQKNGLIFWPEQGSDDSPEGIVAEIERYCRENGLPGFKDSDF